ncbi:MAG: putative RNA methyltransferase [Planctomycetota bacterium]
MSFPRTSGCAETEDSPATPSVYLIIMFPLRCTVRNCDQLLTLGDRGLTCPAGHHFDRAKEGYWNLLQPQDRKSKHPGDTDEAVLARQRWLERGHMEGLVETLCPWIKDRSPAIDLGCGEGSFGRAFFSDFPEAFCGIDLSKRAIKLASRAWRESTWVLCNADRTLPAADHSVGCVLSLFGRRPAEEIKRVLSADGVAVVAIPGEDDLIELREHVQQQGQRRSRWEGVVDEFSHAGLKLLEHQRWQQRVLLQADAIADALAMTYRAVRHSQQAKLQTLVETEVTLAADLMLFASAS